MAQAPIWRHHRSHDSGVTTIEFGGELDMASAPSVQALLFEQLEADGVTGLRVDLAAVDFLDSTAIGALVSGFNHAQQQGRGFAVVNPSAMAQRILTLTGLHEVLTPPEGAGQRDAG